MEKKKLSFKDKQELLKRLADKIDLEWAKKNNLSLRDIHELFHITDSFIDKGYNEGDIYLIFDKQLYEMIKKYGIISIRENKNEEGEVIYEMWLASDDFKVEGENL